MVGEGLGLEAVRYDGGGDGGGVVWLCKDMQRRVELVQ